MKYRILTLSLLCAACAAPVTAETFGDLPQFFAALRQQPRLATPAGQPASEGELTLVKGAPVSQGLHCDLIEQPGDRARHVCHYRCDGLGGIIARPEERIERGAHERPNCYRAVITPKR